jgi:hypothetical protein
VKQYADVEAMARLSKVDYSYIESLEQIRPWLIKRPKAGGGVEDGYPAVSTPEWWALRLRLEQIMGRKIQKMREKLPKGCAPTDERRANDAKWTSLGNEEAQLNYERDGKTREWWLENWGGGRESLKHIRQDFGR